MTHKLPSQARVLLLLAGSMIAGLIVSTSLSTRLETRPDKPHPQTKQPLVVESP